MRVSFINVHINIENYQSTHNAYPGNIVMNNTNKVPVPSVLFILIKCFYSLHLIKIKVKNFLLFLDVVHYDSILV